jgi:hypothetical protein
VTDTLRIRQSSIKEFLRCRRKWAFDYLESIEKVRDPNQPHPYFSLGTLIHSGIEAYWTGGNPAKVVQDAQNAVIDAANQNLQPLSKEWVDVFKYGNAMMSGYPNWAESGEFQNIKVTGCEQEMEWHVGVINGIDVTITGTVDRLEEDRITGWKGVGDIKSTQSFLRANAHLFQLLTYGILVEETLGWLPDYVVTEQIKKVLRTGAAKPPYYLRVEPYVNEPMFARHREHLVEIVHDMTSLLLRYNMVGVESTGLYPNRTKECEYDCPYMPICTGLDDGSNYQNIILTNYKKKEPTTV